MKPGATLFVAGLNHRTASVAVREQLALEEEKIREILLDLTGRGLLDEVMIVSTCNRVEVYGVAAVPGEARTAAFGRLGSHRGLHWRDLEPLVYTVTGDEAALHAFREGVLHLAQDLRLAQDHGEGRLRARPVGGHRGAGAPRPD